MLVKQIFVGVSRTEMAQVWGGGARENDPDCYVAVSVPRQIEALIGYVEAEDTRLLHIYSVGDLIYRAVWNHDGSVAGSISDDKNGKLPSLLHQRPGIFTGDWHCKFAEVPDFSDLPTADQLQD